MPKPKADTNEGSDEIARLRGWCETTLEFIVGGTPEDELKAQFADTIARTASANDVKGLRRLKKDFLEWARGLSSEQQRALDEVLRQRFGEGLSEGATSEAKAVRQILKRGSIRTEEEYRAVSRYVDEFQHDDSKQSELEKADRLLAEFQPRDPAR